MERMTVIRKQGSIADLPPMPDWLSLTNEYKPFTAPVHVPTTRKRMTHKKCMCGCGEKFEVKIMVQKPDCSSRGYLFHPDHVNKPRKTSKRNRWKI